MISEEIFVFLLICILISNRLWILKIKAVYFTCVELLPFPSCTKSPIEIRTKSCYWRYGSKSTDPVIARLNLPLKTLGCSCSLTSISQEISLLTSSKHRHGRVTGGSLRAPTSPAEAAFGAPSEKPNRGRQEYWPILPGWGKFWHREAFASNWAKIKVWLSRQTVGKSIFLFQKGFFL